jgi:hypothetical protein
VAGPIKISVLADVGQAVKSVTHFSDVVDEETKRVVTTLGDSKLNDGFGKVQEGFDVADTRAMGFRDTITGVQDTMTGFQGLLGDRKPGQTFADSMLQVGMGVGDLASGFANFLVPMAAMASGIKTFGLAAKVSAAFQWLLNIAMSANPVMLVVIAIVILVGALVVLYKRSATVRAIVDAMGRAFMSAIGAVRNFVVGAVRWIAGLPGKIGSVFGKAKDLLVNVGKDIVGGLQRGIEGAWHWVTDKISALVSLIPGPVRSLLGISSPSKVFMEIGGHIGTGLALGIEGTQAAVLAATEGLVAIPSSVTGPTSTVSLSSGSVGALGTASNPVTLEIRSSGRAVDDTIVELLRGAIRARGGNVQTILGVT